MYLHLGQDTVVRSDEIIGIFDIENASVSKYTKSFLSTATKRKEVCNVSYEMPKSFIVCRNQKNCRVYIAQISTQTLQKRALSGKVINHKNSK